MTAQTDRTRRPFVAEEAAAILSRTPASLNALLRGLPDGWIAAHEGGDTWSPFDVIGHLISRVLARQYSDEVGPWRAYLRIVTGTQG